MIPNASTLRTVTTITQIDRFTMESNSQNDTNIIKNTDASDTVYTIINDDNKQIITTLDTPTALTSPNSTYLF